MVHLTPADHAKAFVKQLKKDHPIQANFKVKYLKSPSKSGTISNVTICKETNKAHCRVFEAHKHTTATILRIIAHEYMHVLQRYEEDASSTTPDAEATALDFGFRKSAAYCRMHMIPCPAETVTQP